MKRVAIIGVQGLPAKYGGFETCAANLVTHSSEGVEYTVFCSSKHYPERVSTFYRARLKYLPWNSNGVQSILYDGVSMLLSLRHYDTLLVLGISGCIFLPLIRLLTKAKIVVNIDGREYLRSKWGRFAAWFLRKSEAMAVRYAHEVIADNPAIQEYVRETYGVEAHMVAYGADHVLVSMSEQEQIEVLNRYGLQPASYALTIARAEPENNLEMIANAFIGREEKLVIISNVRVSDYSVSFFNRLKNYPQIVVLDSLYDTRQLYALRNQAKCYIHGHSAGGTNPALVEAMMFGRPIFAYNVVYNKETTHGEASYFESSEELAELIFERPLPSGEKLKQIAILQYGWNQITKEYEQLYEREKKSEISVELSCLNNDADEHGSSKEGLVVYGCNGGGEPLNE
jgi:glycosyltransferase involved in cell wall biosynthesis